MKKILILLISLFICINNVNAISASSYIALDASSGDVLMGSNIHEPRLIASISKIMTCIIAIENGNLDEVVEVDDNIFSAVGSSIYLEVGEKITIRDLLYGLMLRSGNDAAVMIAVTISKDMKSFAKLMNEKAAFLHMNDTIFYNSHGLEEEGGVGNKSSSYDMAILTKYAMENKIFRKIFGTKEYTCKTNEKTYHWQNKNKLLRYDFITGGKTGFTIKARRTLVTTGDIDGKKVIVVTLNDGNDWEDHLSIYQKIKDEYTFVNLIDKEKFKIKDDKVYNKGKLYVNNDYGKIVKNADTESLKIKYFLKDKKHYDNNDKVGVVSVYQKDKLIYSEDIFINVQKDSFFSIIKNWFKKIFS